LSETEEKKNEKPEQSNSFDNTLVIKILIEILVVIVLPHCKIKACCSSCAGLKRLSYP